MTRYPDLLISLATIFTMACGGDVVPVLADRPGGPAILDSINGDSVLAYHPTLPIVPPDTVTIPDTSQAPPAPAPQDTTIRTGYWSAAWHGTYVRMAGENHVWWKLITSNCTGSRYGDTGLWCTIVYKVNGDRAAAAKAAVTWLATNPQVANDNHRRENFVEGCIMYDALRPTLTTAQDAAWLARLEAWASQSLGTRTADGDQTIGTTLGIQCLDRVAGTNWSAQIAPMIAATQRYISAFAGGELDESMEYNSGTAVVLMLGLAALPANTYANADSFLIEHARYHPYSVTGDLRQYVQWGDEQNPRDFAGRLFRKMTNWMVTQGLTGDAQLQELITSVVSRYGATGHGSAEPWARSFLFYDPYASASAPSYGRHFSTARGHLYVRTPTSTVLLVASNRTREDHEWQWTFNAEVYRDGEWALTIPRSYGQWPAYRGEGSNGLSLAGVGAMANRGATQVDNGANWSALIGATSGPLYEGYYDPPPSFVRYAGRTAVTAEVNGWTVVITRDTVDMVDPRSLPKFARYRSSGLWLHQQWIAASEGLPWTVWHSRVPPTASGNEWSWQTPGGQTVAIEMLADSPVRAVLVDESTLGGQLAPSAAELSHPVHDVGQGALLSGPHRSRDAARGNPGGRHRDGWKPAVHPEHQRCSGALTSGSARRIKPLRSTKVRQ